MEKEIKLPQISEGSEEATIAEIMVSEGDEIAEDDPIIAVDSDKATVEVPAEEGGTVKDIKVKEEDEIKTGDVILILEVENEKQEADEKENADPSNEDDGAEEQEEKQSTQDQKKESTQDKESKDKSTDKIDKDEGEREYQTHTEDVPAAPLAKRLARELGIKIQAVKPDANDQNRITREDVMAYARDLIEGSNNGKNQDQDYEGIPLPDFSKWGETERERLSSVRKATAKTTELSWQHIPHVTQFDEANISLLEDFLCKVNSKKEIKVTITAVLTKILSLALEKFPKLNSSLDIENKELVYKKYFNIGIAVDAPAGLLIPVIRKTDEKTITEIAEEIVSLAEKAREKKLSSEEMQGGNITISNQGGIGGTAFTPIIFPPQVAILGVSRTYQKLSLNKDQELTTKSVLPLALSYDHRVIDGAEAARYLKWIVDALEQPISAWM